MTPAAAPAPRARCAAGLTVTRRWLRRAGRGRPHRRRDAPPRARATGRRRASSIRARCSSRAFSLDAARDHRAALRGVRRGRRVRPASAARRARGPRSRASPLAEAGSVLRLRGRGAPLARSARASLRRASVGPAVPVGTTPARSAGAPPSACVIGPVRLGARRAPSSPARAPTAPPCTRRVLDLAGNVAEWAAPIRSRASSRNSRRIAEGWGRGVAAPGIVACPLSHPSAGSWLPVCLSTVALASAPRPQRGWGRGGGKGLGEGVGGRG